MKLYKITMTGDFGDTDSMARWTARKSEIPKIKRELRDICNDFAQPDPEVEEVEFATTRDALVQMLNRYADR